MRHFRLLGCIFVVVTLALTACQPLQAPAPQPAPPAPLPSPARARSEATVLPPLPRPAPQQTGDTDAPANPNERAPLPVSTIFDLDWDARAPFRVGLVASEQGALEDQPGASVYHISLRIDSSLTRVDGWQEVRYTNNEVVALDEVAFRLFPNLTGGYTTVSNVTIDGQPVTPGYAQEDSVLFVPLVQPLQPGEQTVIGMDFDVAVPADVESSNYGTFAYLDDVLALAHAYPMAAVYDDEGWNTEIAPEEGDVVYADASYYLVQVTAPADLTVVTSGVTLDQQRAGDVQRLTVAAGPARDFYLAAGEAYEVVSKQVGETTVNSYAPARLRAGAEQAAEIAAAALEAFGRRFGPYPYTELDLVSTATSALGVEYPGIIALNDAMYGRPSGRLLESTVVHEVAHQWFYNVVGNDQVDEPWLDEALSQYATLLYYVDRRDAAGERAFYESLQGRWEFADGEKIPIGLPVAAYTEAGPYSRTYGAIVYGRGALFFEALRDEMGQEAFDEFLYDYAQTHWWGIATAESLRALAEQHCGCDLAALFEEWVYP